MEISLKDLMRISDEKVCPVHIAAYPVEDGIFLRRLENVEGRIVFYYDVMDELRIAYDLKGDMICPCAISLEDVRVPFEVGEDEKIVGRQDEEGFYLNEPVSVEELVLQIVFPEVPIKVVKTEKIEYSRGDGWSFVSEEDYEASKEDRVDPRLQKLKEYRFEEDD